jgi:hypothetical protein
MACILVERVVASVVAAYFKPVRIALSFAAQSAARSSRADWLLKHSLLADVLP